MTASLFVVVNARAGTGRAESVWKSVQAEAARSGLAYEFEVARGPLVAISLVRQALRAGANTIVVVGGNGTVHEAVNGCFLNDAPVADEVTLLVIPAGKSNVFARNLGIRGASEALALLHGGRVRSVDLAVAAFLDERRLPTTRLVVNGAMIGGEGMPTAGPPDFGPLGWTGRLTVDGPPELVVYARVLTVALGPIQAGSLQAPTAKMDDGLLDVVIEDPAAALPKDLAPPGARGDEPVARGRHVVLDMDGEPPILLDGEAVGAGSLELRVLPGALKVYVAGP